MNDQILVILASIPFLFVVISWGTTYRRSVLRICFMALSVGIGLFIGLLIVSAATESLIESFLEIVGISTLFGAAFLLWWPILGRALERSTRVHW